MMRTIKFRAWDNVDYMSSPFTLQDIQENKVQFTKDCILMQFTGLLDKNGKEIYEGDVVKCFAVEHFDIFNIDHECEGVVEWSELAPCFYVHLTKGFNYVENTESETDLPLYYHGQNSDYTFEVIGNIYESNQKEDNDGRK